MSRRKGVCTVQECGRPHYGRGYCKKHWSRLVNTGRVDLAPKPTPIEKFWRNVIRRKSGCWEWIGAKAKNGYGTITIDNKTRYVHRFSYQHFIGTFPKGMCVCHTCDNRSCVNPAHFFLDTIAGNLKDMVRKGRQARGSNNGISRLSENDVREIRRLLQYGVLQKEIAKKFGVIQQTISCIKNGKSWTWLT